MGCELRGGADAVHALLHVPRNLLCEQIEKGRFLHAIKTVQIYEMEYTRGSVLRTS